jgi:predicted glycosyltransferase
MYPPEAGALKTGTSIPAAGRKKVWIDLDNSPHVPFFRPIIAELEGRGHELLVTARDAYQVRELVRFHGLSCKIVGKHHGKHKVMKALGTFGRAVALARIVRKERPALSVCHGSRGCLLASRLLGIPNLTLTDYEHAARIPSIRPNWLMVPSVIPATSFKLDSNRLMTYPGIKEDVYLPQFRPDPGLRGRLGVSSEALMITLRPPANEAHYHNPESESLLIAVLDRLTSSPGIKVVLLPRNKRQEADLRAARKENIVTGRIVIPTQVEDGLNLIWNSDLVISGGGTMNREAAAMGVPVYSIFRGTIGAVDRYLVERGRLVLVENSDDIKTKIKVEKRSQSFVPGSAISPALESIVQHIITLTDGEVSQVGNAAQFGHSAAFAKRSQQ